MHVNAKITITKKYENRQIKLFGKKSDQIVFEISSPLTMRKIFIIPYSWDPCEILSQLPL